MKYELSSKTKEWCGRTLYRIRALKDFITANGFTVKAGDFGGYIEKESNLSQDGNAWVYGNASVYDNAWVYGNASVYGNAWVYGNASVYGNARVCSNASVRGNAEVYSNAKVCGNAVVYGNAEVYGNAVVYGNAEVYGNALVCDRAVVCDRALVCDHAVVCGNAVVCDHALACDNAMVCGNARVNGNAMVARCEHILTIGPVGSRNDYTTFFRTRTNEIGVTCGCFQGSITRFASKVRETHSGNKHAAVYMAAIDLAKLQIELEKE